VTKDAILSFLKEKKGVFSDMFGIQEIGLYGSYSRGDHHESSDINIVRNITLWFPGLFPVLPF
jgi:predicted nucleotidyltransferase